MFLRRIFKGMPDVGPWLSIAEMLAALATIGGVLIGLNMVHNPFAGKVASGTISGVVSDVVNGKPMPEATVQVIDSSSKVIVFEKAPGADGKFEQIVKPGAYSVKAVCDGYAPTEISVSVLEDQARVVRLPIKRQTAAEARAAAAQPASAPQTRVVTVPVVVPSGGGASAPRHASSAGGSPQPASSAGKSKEARVDEQLAVASQLFNQGNLQGAEDACLAAQKIDPSDGRIYAKLIKLNMDPRIDNPTQAKDYAKEGKPKVKKNKETFRDALLELPSE